MIDGKKLENTLNSLNRFITISNRSQYMNHFVNVYHKIKDELKTQSPGFANLYNGFNFAGSYSDNVKVSEPNEFDVNLNISLAKRPSQLLTINKSKPGYCTINILNVLKWLQTNNKIQEAELLKTFTDSDGYLLQNKFLQWFQRLVSNVNRSFETEPGIGFYLIEKENFTYLLKHELNGPASTQNVRVKEESIKFGIDLVPVLAIDDWKMVTKREIPEQYRESWCAVPKPNKDMKNGENSRDWVCAFSRIENKMIKGTEKLKNLIRIFKKLRDTQNLTNLRSFFIKTIFLHKLTELNWKKTPLGTLFLQMFQVMLSYLENKRLPSYWDEDHNLFDKLSDAQLKNIHDRLKKIYNKIVDEMNNDNPEYLFKVLLTEPEQLKMERTVYAQGPDTVTDDWEQLDIDRD